MSCRLLRRLAGGRLCGMHSCSSQLCPAGGGYNMTLISTCLHPYERCCTLPAAHVLSRTCLLFTAAAGREHRGCGAVMCDWPAWCLMHNLPLVAWRRRCCHWHSLTVSAACHATDGAPVTLLQQIPNQRCVASMSPAGIGKVCNWQGPFPCLSLDC